MIKPIGGRSRSVAGASVLVDLGQVLESHRKGSVRVAPPIRGKAKSVETCRLWAHRWNDFVLHGLLVPPSVVPQLLLPGPEDPSGCLLVRHHLGGEPILIELLCAIGIGVEFRVPG